MPDHMPRPLTRRARTWADNVLHDTDGSVRMSALVSLAVAVAAVLVAAVLSVVGGDDSHAALPPAPPVEGPLLWEATSVELSSVEVVGVAQPPDLAAVAAQVAEAIDRYVESATESPLLAGKPSDTLSVLFTPVAQGRLAGPDRAVLTDEPLPRVTALMIGPVTADLTVLTGAGGRPELAVVDLVVKARGFGGEAGGVALERKGELVLLPAEGGWQIDSYRVDLEARGDGVPPFGLVLWPFGEAA